MEAEPAPVTFGTTTPPKDVTNQQAAVAHPWGLSPLRHRSRCQPIRGTGRGRRRAASNRCRASAEPAEGSAIDYETNAAGLLLHKHQGNTVRARSAFLFVLAGSFELGIGQAGST